MAASDGLYLGAAVVAAIAVGAMLYDGRPGKPANLRPGEVPPAALGSTPAVPPRSLTITAKAQELVMSAGADAALDAGRRGHLPTEVKVMVAGTDRHGRPATLPGLTFTWDLDDLRQIDWERADPFTMVDLALVNFDGQAGVKAAHEWCFGADARKGLTPAFCGKPFEDAASDFMAER